MARLFDDASQESLNLEQAPFATYPLAMVCRFNKNADIEVILMSIVNKSVNDQYHTIFSEPSGNARKLFILTASGGIGFEFTTAGGADNTWHHAAALFVSATDRRVLLNGANKGTDATNLTPSGLDRTSIGVRNHSVPDKWMSGMIAEAAIYDLSQWPGATNALKADAFEKILPSLAEGFSPLHFPLGLVTYWPLIRGLNDKVGGYNLTATGTTVANHPRVILPHGPQ